MATLHSRWQWRSPLRARCLAALDGNSSSNSDGDGRARDASLKKNTAFVRKLRDGVSEKTREALLRDLSGLRPDRYLQEAVAAIGESRLGPRTADVHAMVEICAELHVRFAPAFALELWQTLEAQYAAAASAGPAELQRARSVLRFLGELFLTGVVPQLPWTADPRAFPLRKPLRALLEEADADEGRRGVLVHFAKHAGEELLHLCSRRSAAQADATATKAAAAAEGVTAPIPVQTELREALDALRRGLEKRLPQERGQCRALRRRAAELQLTRGCLPEDVQQRLEAAESTLAKVHADLETLSDLFGRDPPAPLAAGDGDGEDDEYGDAAGGAGFISTSAATFGGGEADFVSDIYDDLETQLFYEDLTDLADFVPSDLLGGGAKAGAAIALDEELDETAVTEAEQEETKDEDELAELAEPPSETPVADEAAEEASRANSGNEGGQSLSLDTLLASLPDMLSRELVDTTAREFALLNGGKRARNRLIEALTSVRASRTDLVPFLARFIATLSPFFPEIRDAVADHLFRDCGRLARKEHISLNVKLFNVRYLAHMTMFRQIKPSVVFWVLKALVADHFSPVCVQVACDFLETCGRFLKNTVGKKTTRFAYFVDLLYKKGEVAARQHGEWDVIVYPLNAAHEAMLPPRSRAAASRQKQREPLQLFLRRLLYVQLSPASVEAVLTTLRRFDWGDAGVRQLLFRAFRKPEKMASASVALLASLVSGLYAHHEEFCIAVVDAVLESIRYEMEINVKENAQKRLAHARFLGELYAYCVVDHGVVFDTLYSLLSFGHADPLPHPQRVSAFDPPHDYFRVLLCLELLGACGAYFDRGALQRRLDGFLVRLEYYYWVKRRPVPEYVDNLLTKTLEQLRPHHVRCTSLEESVQRLLDLEQAEAELKGAAGDTVDDDEGEDGDAEYDEGSDYNELAEETDGEVDGDIREEMVRLRVAAKNEEQLREEQRLQEVFDREYAEMLSESIETRRTTPLKSGLLYSALGAPRQQHQQQQWQRDPASVGEPNRFTLIMRKGRARQLHLPASTGVAQRLQRHRDTQERERQEVKAAVLSLVQRSTGTGSGDAGGPLAEALAAAANLPPLLPSNPNLASDGSPKPVLVVEGPRRGRRRLPGASGGQKRAPTQAERFVLSPANLEALKRRRPK